MKGGPKGQDCGCVS